MAIDLGAGGGASFFGQTLEATASGAISNGAPVLLNDDGTVSAVSATGGGLVSGLKMYVVGSTSDTVYEYNLSSPYSLNGASLLQSLDVSSEEGAPTSIRFNNDGTKMFILGDGGNDINEYELSTAYDITSASFTDSFSVSTQETSPTGFCFNNDGTKFFIIGLNARSVYEYSLSTAFDISTASFVGGFSAATEVDNPEEIVFNNDGTRFYIVSRGNRYIFQYQCTTPYTISTASYMSISFYVLDQEADPTGLEFSPDGTKMFISGFNGDEINSYTLMTPFEVNTAGHSETFSVATEETTPRAITFGKRATSNLSQEKYIGIADGAYADGATATIQLVGAVNTAQTGLIAGKTHYVQPDGSLSRLPSNPIVEAGYAVSTTNLVVKGSYGSVTSSTTNNISSLPFNIPRLSSGQKLMFVSSSTITLPVDTEVIVTCVGGGGSGRSFNGNATTEGGGAGGLCQSILKLTGGEEYTIEVGATEGNSSFYGPNITTMVAEGANSEFGGGASGGNIINNPGGNGGIGTNAGGGAIGILGPGQSGTANSSTGASIDVIPDIFPFLMSVSPNYNRQQNSSPYLNQFMENYAYGKLPGGGGTMNGGAGGTGSGGGSIRSGTSGAGGAGGFPGGGGGGASGGNTNAYAKTAGQGAWGCVVIEGV